MISRNALVAVLLSSLGGLTGTDASANVLTFDAADSCDGGVCGNYSFIKSNYGSDADIAVSYLNDSSSSGSSAQLQWWDFYSGMPGIAWGASGGVPEIKLTPIGGKAVKLLGFDFGSYQNASRGSQVTVVDGLNNVLFSSGPFTVAATPKQFSFANLVSNNGFGIKFGPDGFNVGIDNVSFSAVTATSGVPEPSTWAMLLIGFAGLGFASYRGARRATVSA